MVFAVPAGVLTLNRAQRRLFGAAPILILALVAPPALAHEKWFIDSSHYPLRFDLFFQPLPLALTAAVLIVTALAADLASSPAGQALEEATGHPSPIYVVVPVGGALVIARGAVYSHYEFPVPFAGRLTDETWRAQLDANSAPPLPDWTGLFTKP